MVLADQIFFSLFETNVNVDSPAGSLKSQQRKGLSTPSLSLAAAAATEGG